MIFYETNRTNAKQEIYHQNDECLNFPLHLHSSFEFIYVTEGTIELSIDGENFNLEKNHAAIIFPNQIHSYNTKHFSKDYLCVFSPNLVYDFYNSVKSKFALSPVFPFNDNRLIEILQTEKASTYLIKSCLYSLVNSFCGNVTFGERDIKNFDCASKILLYVENNFTSDITIKSLASHLGYDYHYLSGMLNKMLGVNFPTIVNGYRVQLANHLLSTTDKTATEISSLCGYDSIRSFNRNYKLITGKAPTK